MIAWVISGRQIGDRARSHIPSRKETYQRGKWKKVLGTGIICGMRENPMGLDLEAVGQVKG